MPLDWRKNWNVASGKFATAADAPVKGMLTPDEDSVREIIREAAQFGGFNTPQAKGMLDAAIAPKGRQVTVREGAHQIEEGEEGFSVHIGTKFAVSVETGMLNYHLNLAQTTLGTAYITSISWGSGAAFGSENRSRSPPT
ncbi:MAG: hypothetical protein WA840_18455 [Caulobacteraceae bacterium]